MPRIIPVNGGTKISVSKKKPADPGNYAEGRNLQSHGYNGIQVQPSRIVIHVADGTYNGTLSWFADPKCDVSAHFTIGMNGEIAQSVDEVDTAYHSGDWAMNVRSFGIEHEGQPSKGKWVPTREMYEASSTLTAYLCNRWDIPVDRQHIIGHNEVNLNRAARKNCPGPTWDWKHYIELVESKVAQLEIVRPAPAHGEDDSDNKRVSIFGGNADFLGHGTLIVGTDKVYMAAPLPVTVKVSETADPMVRKVRLFDAGTNGVLGTGYYTEVTGAVHIATWPKKL